MIRRVIIVLFVLMATPAVGQVGDRTLTVEETIWLAEPIAFCGLTDTRPLRQLLARAAPEALPALALVLEHEGEAHRWGATAAVLARVGGDAEAAAIGRCLSRMRGTLPEHQWDQIDALLGSLAVLAVRGEPRAERLLRVMARPGFWSKRGVRYDPLYINVRVKPAHELAVRALGQAQRAERAWAVQGVTDWREELRRAGVPKRRVRGMEASYLGPRRWRLVKEVRRAAERPINVALALKWLWEDGRRPAGLADDGRPVLEVWRSAELVAASEQAYEADWNRGLLREVLTRLLVAGEPIRASRIRQLALVNEDHTWRAVSDAWARWTMSWTVEGELKLVRPEVWVIDGPQRTRIAPGAEAPRLAGQRLEVRYGLAGIREGVEQDNQAELAGRLDLHHGHAAVVMQWDGFCWRVQPFGWDVDPFAASAGDGAMDGASEASHP
jgi:hypothetical protein